MTVTPEHEDDATRLRRLFVPVLYADSDAWPIRCVLLGADDTGATHVKLEFGGHDAVKFAVKFKLRLDGTPRPYFALGDPRLAKLHEAGALLSIIEECRHPFTTVTLGPPTAHEIARHTGTS